MSKLFGLALDALFDHWRIAAAVAGVAALVAFHFSATNRAWHEGYAAHEAEVSEKTRELNDRLDRLAEKHRAATEAYLRERREAQQLKDKLDDQALSSDNADRPALDAGSVRRLPHQP